MEEVQGQWAISCISLLSGAYHYEGWVGSTSFWGIPFTACGVLEVNIQPSIFYYFYVTLKSCISVELQGFWKWIQLTHWIGMYQDGWQIHIPVYHMTCINLVCQLKSLRTEEKKSVKEISFLVKLDLGNLWLLKKLYIVSRHRGFKDCKYSDISF